MLGVIDESGEINRKVLGPVVFADRVKKKKNINSFKRVIRSNLLFPQAKLEKLNGIVWPEIWRLAEEKISQAHSEGYSICVVDAAVMLKAGWQRHVHEVWVAIAPNTEVSVPVADE